MLFRKINALTGYSAALDALTQTQCATLVEIVFCYRLGSLSATAVFGEVEALRDVAGQVPASILKVWLRARLVSKSMVMIRKPCSLALPIPPQRQLKELKRYRQDADCKQRLLIDRFDATDRAKSIGEVERAGGPDLWKGPSELPIKAIQAGLQVIYFAKLSKDQIYLRILSG